MKRRTFLNRTALTGCAGIAGNSPAHAQPGKNMSISNRMSAEPGRVLRLPGEYYRHYPVDFFRGKEGALGFKGWGESAKIEVPAEETALVPMHIWNIGFSPELPFSPEGPAGGVMQMLEWVSRSAPIIKKEIPPILEAARKAGIQVIHAASSENYAKKYPGYQNAKSLAGHEPEGLPEAPRHNEVKPPDDRKDALLFGEDFVRCLEYYEPRLDFPEPAKPLDTEYVVATTHQFNEVLRKHGIWNIIYIGFAINWCLWLMPCGMVDMSRLGYRCSCIREAVTAVENKETTRGEQNKQQALWRTSLMFGYIHSAGDFIEACGRLETK
ncbi:MAG: isochorismatase family protein [Candidatus Latescibacteria bacterium]|jgi:nicotinamidase-related amidase|nr:isochorismatase family protein [Candidatus Latescibacterota bacterium]